MKFKIISWPAKSAIGRILHGKPEQSTYDGGIFINAVPPTRKNDPENREHFGLDIDVVPHDEEARQAVAALDQIKHQAWVAIQRKWAEEREAEYQKRLRKMAEQQTQ